MMDYLENLFYDLLSLCRPQTPVFFEFCCLYLVQMLWISKQRKLLRKLHDGISWVKRSGNKDFDVPMVSYDSAEVCELVGAFLLNNLSHAIDKTSVGLYRDDGLGVFKSHSGPESERKRKEIIKTFNAYKLSITIETSIRFATFLDTTF